MSLTGDRSLKLASGTESSWVGVSASQCSEAFESQQVSFELHCSVLIFEHNILILDTVAKTAQLGVHDALRIKNILVCNII